MIDILECTMRDASYPISYQFTAEDTAIVVAGLYQAGFKRIEIGHGLGLGASGQKFGFAAATDEEYVAAASAVLPSGIFGAFIIPGIADLKHVELVAKYKGGFVRIGTNVNETAEGEAFIKKGKDLGLEVSCNLMKTYSASTSEVVERSLQLQEWGADIIAVVDSAGGMMTGSVAEYVTALADAGIKKIGFHGHNNLQLAVANSIAAIEAGATIIDSTLRGLGRSSGNAQTEALVFCMERLGYQTGIDFYKMMDISEKHIAPIARGRGSNNIELVSGYSLFHSGFTPMLERVAKKKNVDLRKLILSVGDGNGQTINEETVSKISDGLQAEKNTEPATSAAETINLFERTYSSNIAQTPAKDLDDVLFNELCSIASKTGRMSVLTISLGKDFAKTNPFIRWSDNKLIGNIEITGEEHLKNIIDKVDGRIDCILVDECLLTDLSVFKDCRSNLINFSEENALVFALDAFLNGLKTFNNRTRFVIKGVNSTSLALAQILLRKNHEIAIYEEDEERRNSALNFFAEYLKINSSSKDHAVAAADPEYIYDIVISFTKTANDHALLKLLGNLSPEGLAVDASRQSFPVEFIEAARERNVPLYRLDMRAALAAEVSLRIETSNLIKNVMGRNVINGIPVLAGGVIGAKGSIIIDSIVSPTNILGVADGNGGILDKEQESEFSKNMKEIKNYILAKRMVI